MFHVKHWGFYLHFAAQGIVFYSNVSRETFFSLLKKVEIRSQNRYNYNVMV